MSNVVGYARVSRHDQNPAAQEAELRAAGAGRVFVDHGESSRVKDATVARMPGLSPPWRHPVGPPAGPAGGQREDGYRDDHRPPRARCEHPGVSPSRISTRRHRWVGRCSGSSRYSRSCASTPYATNTKRGLAHARAQGRVGGRPSVRRPSASRPRCGCVTNRS